jgi:hypothetical protein
MGFGRVTCSTNEMTSSCMGLLSFVFLPARKTQEYTLAACLG